jgi:hypothetical protein
MDMKDDREPRVPRHDVVKLLGEAAELAVRSEGRRDDSLRLAEVEAAAAEAGIDPAFVRAALEARRSGSDRWSEVAFGPSGTWVAERRFTGRMKSEDALRAIADIQVVAGIPGGRVEQPGEGSWRLAAGSKGHVQVTSDGDEVRVAIVADRGARRLWLLGGGLGGGGFLGTQIGGLATVALQIPTPETMAAGIVVGGVVGAVTGMLGGRSLWKASAERWRRRADAALARVSDALSGVPGRRISHKEDQVELRGPHR